MSTLKEFIDNLPETEAYKATLVRLCGQLDDMKHRDAEFLRQVKHKLQKRLADIREQEEKQASNWIGQMKIGATLEVVSSFSALLYVRSKSSNESISLKKVPNRLVFIHLDSLNIKKLPVSDNLDLKSSYSIPSLTKLISIV